VTRTALRLRAFAAAALLALLAAGPAAASPAAKPKPKPNPNTGIVDIFTTLGYQNGSAAGTGMVISPSGEVLTNNHVIRGATTFRVVVVTTGRSYKATVVGYDVDDDVAVLQLAGASNLKTIPLGNSSKLKVGQAVVARGNAGGKGGTPSVASGTITRLHQQIIAQDGEGGSETLTNLIETNAPIQPGDSGGPLLNAKGRVVGIVTAGSVTFRFQTTGGLGYAITINRALTIARQIEAGKSSATVHIGPTAFLGVGVGDAPGGGAGVAQIVSGSAADAAGLVVGDVITSLNGMPISNMADLRAAVLALTPGTPVAIEWTDLNGFAQSGTITPASGPPQ
jgi:S1-C subfamily serine protease